uniref:Neurotransmitter-gated ion-channel ligand-binding domain-containing protein n=1 Tax=Setaria digitata TaxID=48799 RepID=A0A915PT41_9BILA
MAIAEYEAPVMITLDGTCLAVKLYNRAQSSSVNRVVRCSDEEERLMVDVFRGYNSLIQPVRNLNETPIIVKIALQLVLLINVDEKDQVMHTNVWLTLKWYDFQMRWNPVDYGEIQNIRVAPDKVWLPDIVLFNNADGNYEVSFMCNVVINYKGEMLWVPPAIYKSSCIIDVEFFPFDEQTCHLIFGSWTYNENEIKLEFEQAEWVDLSEYAPSSIWDLMDAPAALVNKRSRIEFQIMPKLLCMQRPRPLLRNITQKNGHSITAALSHIGEFKLNPSMHHPLCPSADTDSRQPPAIELTHVESMEQLERDPSTNAYYPLSADALRAIDAIEYITNHLKQDEEYKMYRDDWKYVAMIIDRLLLYVFFGITLGGTCGIIFSAPYVFQGVDQRAELQRLIHLYKNGGEI